MLTWGQIEQLAAFEAGEARVLSVYLDLGRCHLGPRSYLTAFRNLVLRKSEWVEVLEWCALLREAASVQTWLASAEVTGSGLAAFSCAAEGLWQREFLQVRLPNHLAYERRVDFGPSSRCFRTRRGPCGTFCHRCSRIASQPSWVVGQLRASSRG